MQGANQLSLVPVICLWNVSSCPAGALMGSVTAKISAIHLTKQEQPDCVPSSSPSSPSPLECQGGDDQLSGYGYLLVISCFISSLDIPSNVARHFPSSESVVQADGGEEEQPDEPESPGSDDGEKPKLPADSRR